MSEQTSVPDAAVEHFVTVDYAADCNVCGRIGVFGTLSEAVQKAHRHEAEQDERRRAEGTRDE